METKSNIRISKELDFSKFIRLSSETTYGTFHEKRDGMHKITFFHSHIQENKANLSELVLNVYDNYK